MEALMLKIKNIFLLLIISCSMCSCSYLSNDEYSDIPVVNNPSVTGDTNTLGAS